MLCQKRSSRWVLGRYLLALPLLGLLVTLVAARVATTSSEVNADKILVQGRVMSADGKGMPGVNIVVKNETSGTNTDSEGKYKISVEGGKTLVFSFVGFGSEERIVNKEKINVLMEEETLTIGENASIGSFPPPPPMPPVKIGNEVFTVVERQPEFEGGGKALMAFIQKNLKYPAAAARANVEGRVFIQFVVDKTGLVKDSKILKGLGFGCNEEALRIMEIMPKWKPGKQSGKTVAVKYNLPIQFQLKERAKETRESTGYAISQDKFNVEGYQENVTRIRATVNENRLVNPLYFVDGQETTSVVKLEPDDILSVSVLRGGNATKKYGERAKNGAVEITMKKKEINLIKVGTNSSNAQLAVTMKPEPSSNLDGKTLIKFLKVVPNAVFNDNVKPLYVLDEKEVSEEQVMDTTFLKPRFIEKMEVLKGMGVTTGYGERGKNGVILITTKKK